MRPYALPDQGNLGDKLFGADRSSGKDGARRQRHMRQALVALLCIAFVIAGWHNAWQGYGQVREKKARLSPWRQLKEQLALRRESLFLLDMESVRGFVEKVDGAAGGQVVNYLPAGGVLDGSPYLKERFAAWGAGDGAEALLWGEAVYFVIEQGRDHSWIGKYMGRRFGPVTVELVDTLAAGDARYCVYQIRQRGIQKAQWE